MNTIWKSNLKYKLKKNFFRAVVESVLVYDSITWTLTVSIDTQIDGEYTRMLRAAMNKTRRNDLANTDLYGNISKATASIREQRL